MILIYRRVSTLEQAADGTTSMAQQERKCRGVAMARGAKQFDVVDYSDPGVSGAIPLRSRPAGGRLFADVASGDIIVASKLDRLFRSASDALVSVEDLQKRGVGVILADIGLDPVTANGTAKLFFSILSTFAEFERGRIAERMEEGRRAKRERNGHQGGDAPYGFKVVGSGRAAMLEPVPEEQAVIAQVKAMKRKHDRRTILRVLRKTGVRTRSGIPFGATQVQRLLERV